YYVNDAGRQMNILATSVWLRYLELCGDTVTFPTNGYQGDYIWDIAANLHRTNADALRYPVDVEQYEDKELLMDALIKHCQDVLGKEAYQLVFQKGLSIILNDIRHDLEQFGVDYDEWFSESSLDAQQAIDQLKATGHTYDKDGALWFRSTDFGDEKDRVLVRENGHFTYFATDIAYHQNKLARGFDQIINIWGADHHGYVSRVKAAMTALGADEKRLTVLLVQFATLYRGKERLQMSTRSGQFVTLRELREEVGRDAARYFYIQRKSEQHLNFDLALAKLSKKVNPVYYIQYAHTRIASVFRTLQERAIVWTHKTSNLARLESEYEQSLLVTLSHYPEVIEMAAQAYEPHQLTYYLHHVAENFHACYDAPNHKILIEDEELRNARLSLIAATQHVLRNGLTIIGVEAKEVM
ncbi:MAG: arginine--tRNA ligase, partial [Thiotrichaceae bacterium]|nr:arginine--tRNA ligase [Thiotrichaceae bacterium]